MGVQSRVLWRRSLSSARHPVRLTLYDLVDHRVVTQVVDRRAGSPMVVDFRQGGDAQVISIARVGFLGPNATRPAPQVKNALTRDLVSNLRRRRWLQAIHS